MFLVMMHQKCMPYSPCWKSRLHADLTMYSGYFIAGCLLPTGHISYHLSSEWWGRCQVPEMVTAPPFDDYTAADVLEREIRWLRAA